jgi:polysaccharide export outer membrane protein
MDAASPLAEALEPDQAQQVRWVNVDGRWVAVEAEAMPDAAEPGAAAPGASVEQALGGQLPPPDQLVTQRVIEIDSRRLMEGDATQNIVVRPGDVIRVPIPRSGNIFVGGAIARPGTYSLPGEKTLTLKQLVISAGGLSPVGIPERVDLTRRIDEDTEAIVRLNLRSIFEGVQPDIYLKPDDTINVGTNLPAPFLAVIRNSFRMTYGFGFLLDRNFSDKVFGPIDDN